MCVCIHTYVCASVCVCILFSICHPEKTEIKKQVITQNTSLKCLLPKLTI